MDKSLKAWSTPTISQLSIDQTLSAGVTGSMENLTGAPGRVIMYRASGLSGLDADSC